nr:hypothetical protein [Legionella jordanis]
MSSVKSLKTLDSLIFLTKLTRQTKSSPSFTTVDFQGCSANYFANNRKKKKGLMVVFHGANQQGNADQRYYGFVNGLTAIGYDCLLLQLQAQIELRPPRQEDYDAVTNYLNHFAETINNYKNVSYIGPSTSCLYMSKVAANPGLKRKVDSLCFISPYFDPGTHFRELLETPRSFYAQLVMLKMMLFSEFEQQPSKHFGEELLLFNRAIDYCLKNKFEASDSHHILNFIAKESPKSKRLLKFIQNLGKTGFIDEELQSSFNDIVNKSKYDDCLSKIQSKITLIHAYTDPIFSPENSCLLAEELTHRRIDNHLAITKMIAHADLVTKNIVKESIGIVKALNHFFSAPLAINANFLANENKYTRL